MTETCKGDDLLFHTIIEVENNTAVGMASYLRIQAGIGMNEVRQIHFSPLLKKTKVATEAIFLMILRVLMNIVIAFMKGNVTR